MFSKAKITKIYFMADDFCKEFTLQQKKYMVEDKAYKHRNKPNRMNDAEIMVILILLHSGEFRCFKHYYKEYNMYPTLNEYRSLLISSSFNNADLKILLDPCEEYMLTVR